MNEFYGAVLLVLWAIACAIQDARSRRISNWLSLGMLAVAGIWLGLHSTSLTAAPSPVALIGLALGVALALPGYILGRMGAADVKLLASLGLASSPMHVLLTVAFAALAMVFWTLSGRHMWPLLGDWLRRQLRQMDPADRQAQPYAPFFLTGLLFSIALTG